MPLSLLIGLMAAVLQCGSVCPVLEKDIRQMAGGCSVCVGWGGVGSEGRAKEGQAKNGRHGVGQARPGHLTWGRARSVWVGNKQPAVSAVVAGAEIIMQVPGDIFGGICVCNKPCIILKSKQVAGPTGPVGST